MLIGYGGYSLAFAISSSVGTSAAAFTAPDDGSALADGRTGQVQACVWSTGTQSTSSYVQITVTITDAVDTGSARQGVCGIANVSGLPEGTKIIVGSTTQRLVKGPRGELCAWFLPNDNGATLTIRIYNDVSGSASIVAGTEFSIGEIFVGRVISLPSLITGSNPNSDLVDPTAFQRSSGGQLWQLMRKPYRQIQAQLGRFTTNDVGGGSNSSIDDGGNPSAKIDIKALRDILSTTTACAVCDIPNGGSGDGMISGGIRYDQDKMQGNWMVCRPSSIGQIVMDQPPLWSWNPTFQEAT